MGAVGARRAVRSRARSTTSHAMAAFVFISPDSFEDWLRSLGEDASGCEAERRELHWRAQRAVWMPQRFNVALPTDLLDDELADSDENWQP